MIFSRRRILATGLGLSASSLVGLPTAGLAANGDTYDVAKLMAPDGLADRPEGSADAKVTVVEYSSPTCPHCTRWHVEVLPVFRARYLETGKVRFAFRPYVRNVLDAVVFLVAGSATTDEQYFAVVEAYFSTAEQWAVSETPRDAMLAVAMQMGFTEESFDKSLTNQELFAGMETLRDQAASVFDVTGTPTFFVNGKTFVGGQSIEDLAAAIDPLLA